MSEVTTTIFSQAQEPKHLATGETRSTRNLAMLAFVALSLFIGMSVHQTTAIERGSWQYFAYVALAVVLPLFSLPEIVRTLFDPCRLLLLFLLWAGSWQLLAGDGRAAAQ